MQRSSLRSAINQSAVGWGALNTTLAGGIKNNRPGELLAPGKLEFYALCLLLFFLPYSEFFKHFFLLIFLVAWLARRYVFGVFGGRIDILDGLMLAIPALGFLSAALSGSNSVQYAVNNLDLLAMMFLGIAIKRTSWESIQILFLAITTVAGTAFALVAGFIEYKTGSEFTLRSVGHINHAAIYVVLVSAWALSLCFLSKTYLGICFWFFISFGLFLIQMVFESRATTGIYLICLFILILIILGRTTIRNSFLLVIALGLGIVLLHQAFPVDIENVFSVATDFQAGLSDRIPIYKAALLAATEHPLLGYGSGSFYAATSSENLAKILSLAGSVYDSGNYTHHRHAHNIYLSYLVERGVAGLICLLSFFIFSLWSSIRQFMKTNDFAAIASGLALFVVLGAGMVNTTFHHEHGLLSVVLIALPFGRFKRCSLAGYETKSM